MPYQPDDDRFYESLNQAGQNYLNQRGKVAEDQAATTRELGKIYGQALPNTVNAGLTGAQWAQNRAAQQQQMDLAQTSEQRTQQKFVEDQQDRQMKLDAERAQAAYEAAPAEEAYAKGAGIEYVPGMTHQDVERMAHGNQMGFEGRKLTSEEQRAQASQMGENTRATQRIAAEKELENMRLAGQREIEGMKVAAQKPKEPPAETLNKLSDAEAAQKSLDALADEFKTHTGKFSGVTQYFPGTDAAKFDDAVNVHAQNIAAFLKGGRGSPTPADIELAKQMLPKAADSKERAEEKLNRLSQEIAEKKKDHAHALSTAGFNIGDLGVNVPDTGKKYDLRHQVPENEAVAAGGLKPVEQMTDAEVMAELAARKGKK